MDNTQEDNEYARKPSQVTDECKQMLREVVMYIAENSEKQAEIMLMRFKKIVASLEHMPGIGTKCENGMRKFLLGKFPYYIYYREKEEYISIRGIWHTSRGTNFEDNE